MTQSLPHHPVVYNNQRILTTRQIADAYETDSKHISNNFQQNKERFTIGKHYFVLEGNNKKSFLADLPSKEDGSKHAKFLYLWTEKGAALHAKLLTTDKAWEFYEIIVDEYYRLAESAKRTEPPKPKPLYQQRREKNADREILGYWNIIGRPRRPRSFKAGMNGPTFFGKRGVWPSSPGLLTNFCIYDMVFPWNEQLSSN